MEFVSALADDPVRLWRFPSIRALTALLVLSLRQQARGLAVGGPGAALPAPRRPGVDRVPDGARALSRHVACRDSPVRAALQPHTPCLGPAGCAALCRRDHSRRGRGTDADVPAPAAAAAIRRSMPSSSWRRSSTVALLTSIFTVATLLLMALLTGEWIGAELLVQGGKTAVIFSLAQVAYCGLFALIALLMRRSLLIGVVYIISLRGSSRQLRHPCPPHDGDVPLPRPRASLAGAGQRHVVEG